jgi:hypothetical protein
MQRTLPLRPAAEAESAGSGSAYGTLMSSRKCHAGTTRGDDDSASETRHCFPAAGAVSGACDAAEGPEVILGLILLNEVEVEVDEDSEAHHVELALMSSGSISGNAAQILLPPIQFPSLSDLKLLVFMRYRTALVNSAMMNRNRIHATCI